jgi:hypothetical protein
MTIRAPWPETFASGSAAARRFYSENADFYDHVEDAGDPVREFLDAMPGRGRSGKRMAETKEGRAILSKRGDAAKIRAALAVVFRRARRKRWTEVDWADVDRLNEFLAAYYRPISSRVAQQPAPYWLPMAVITDDTVGTLSTEDAMVWYRHDARVRLADMLSRLKDALRANAKNIDATSKRQIRRRIKEWEGWVRHPSRIPLSACLPDASGYACDYPMVAGELHRVEQSARQAYNPTWFEDYAGSPGFPARLEPGEQAFLPIDAYEEDAQEGRCSPSEAARVLGRRSAAARKKTPQPRRQRVIMGRVV